MGLRGSSCRSGVNGQAAEKDEQLEYDGERDGSPRAKPDAHARPGPE